MTKNVSSSDDCWFGPCSQGDCWDSDDPESRTADCWVLAFCFLSVGIFLILFAEVYGDPKDCLFGLLRMYSQSKGDNTDDVDLVESPFTKTTRTEENFIRQHDDPNLEVPTDYGPEYNPTSVQASVLPLRGFRPTSDKWMLQSRSTLSVLLGSLGLAMIGSAVSTILWLMMDYETSCLDSDLLSTWAQEVAAAFETILSHYSFYPIFLLVGYISFIANRWRDWMVGFSSCDVTISVNHGFLSLRLISAGKLPFPARSYSRYWSYLWGILYQATNYGTTQTIVQNLPPLKCHPRPLL
jgi:hypothetical protein